jgi:hypothetical protein
MKVVRLFLSISFLLLAASLVAVIQQEGPESKLIGVWEEVAWEYEKVNHDGSMNDFQINDGQREEICQTLIIHQSENWTFTPDHRLTLQSEDGESEQVVWNIKGRGHILELQHEDHGIEDYQIQFLTRDSLIVHFNFDLQVRGIVKMTFKRKTDHDA